MNNEKSLLPSSGIAIPENSNVYFRASVERCWRVNFGREKFYLTGEEKNAFLKAVADGAKFVQVGNLTLSANFYYICPIKTERMGRMTGDGGVEYRQEPAE